MGKKRIIQLPTADAIPNGAYIAIDSTVDSEDSNTGTRKIRVTTLLEKTVKVMLTQAEYDALPSDKLTDGKVYYITDESKIIINGTVYGAGEETASDVSYDNTSSQGVQATNVQDALDEAFTRTVILANAVSDISDSYAQTYYLLQGYSVGDYVLKDRTLYKCISPVASGGEAWNPDKWEEVKIADEIKEVNSTIDNLLIQKSIENTDIATFTDGSNLPMPSLKVGIEPQQDLHGYDAPWPPGGGKNMLEVTGTMQTLNGVTFSVNSDGTINVSGTASETTAFSVRKYQLLSDYGVESGTTYMLSGTPLGLNGSAYIMLAVYGSGPEWRDTIGDGVSFTPSDVTKQYRVLIIVQNGATINATFKPMICLASASNPTTFAPYSNICPISGHTEANVVVSPTTDVEDGTTYNIQFKDGDNPLKVYGGTLDVVSGELVVDRAFVTFNGSESWDNLIGGGINQMYISVTNAVSSIDGSIKTVCDKFKSISIDNRANNYNTCYTATNAICFNVENYTTKTWKTWLASNNVQVVYKLVTPITYQLTPTQVKSLLGSNNVWADTGKILKLEYLANATDVIASLDARITALENA